MGRAMTTGARRCGPVLVLLLLLVRGSPAQSADEVLPSVAAIPSVETIRANVRAAEGPAPETYRETDETVRSDGTKTIEHDFVTPTGHRYTFNSPPFHTESGVNGTQAWHMNDNGQVIHDQPNREAKSADQRTTYVEAVHLPIEGYMVASLDAKKRGTKRYVDSKTWHVTRAEWIRGSGTIVTTYDDVRPDHGRTFAHHWRIEDLSEHSTEDVRITEYAPDGVTAADIAIPPSQRMLVEFPEGVSSVDLPTKFTQHIYVRVMINGRGLDFVLDTGADELTIDATVAHELGLPAYAKRTEIDAGRIDTARTIVSEMHVGPLTLHNVAIQEIPQGNYEGDGVKVVGLLGFDFLAQLGVTIDYADKRVTVVPGAAYVPPSDPRTSVLDVRIGEGQPRATVVINGTASDSWVLDTGAPGTFLIFDHFARAHPEALRGQGEHYRGVRLLGVGGGFDTTPYRISSLRLANVNFQQFIGYRVVEPGAYPGDDDGVIGSTFLQLFTVGLDYTNGRIYLVPNRAGKILLKAE
jgi:predicted aspartyl protease